MFKPMRGTEVDFEKLVYPVYASVKGDGIRVNIYEGLCRTKSLKPLPNVFTRNLLESYPELEGIEAEIFTSGNISDPDSFNKATSAFMSHKGEPEIFLWIFDLVRENTPFNKRYEELCKRKLPPFARILRQTLINSKEELLEYINKVVSAGHEGVMIRHAYSLYKFGKSTATKGELLKYKPFVDDEAVFIGVEEGMTNTNEKKTNELGRSKRSSSKEGMVPNGLAGVILAQHPKWGVLRISGFKDDLAKDMLINTDRYMGKLVTFKYQDHGTMDSPRLPKFKGFRSIDDMSLED